MQNGDLVFVHHKHDVQLYCEVEGITPNEIRLSVINGGYTLVITKATPPTGRRGDYNDAIEWFKTTRKEPE